MNKAYLFYLLRRGIIGGRGSSPWVQIVNDFETRVIADGGTLEAKACLNTDVQFLTENPVAPAFTGLLNDYSGAAAAYSLRLLDNTYTGDAIRVRRSSDNAEQNIGFLNNELDTASLETFCSGTDGFVAIWYDQSGNAVNAANATAGNQPQIVSSGTSLGYIQNLTTTSNQRLQSVFSYSAGNAFSSFIVSQNFGTAVIGGTVTSAYYYAVSQSGSSSNAQSSFNAAYYNNGSSIGTTRNDIHNATTSFGELTTLGTLTSGSTENATLGYSSSGFNLLRLKEYIIYDNQTISRTGVEDNIITHYGF